MSTDILRNIFQLFLSFLQNGANRSENRRVPFIQITLLQKYKKISKELTVNILYETNNSLAFFLNRLCRIRRNN